MATPWSTLLLTVSQRFVTYMGMSTVIFGLIGGFLNIVVFLSLKTFRQNSGAFFLTVMSFVNMCQLITGQFSRVLITGFGIDLTEQSRAYCKFRSYGIQVFGYISFTCLCLATLDQFLATCASAYWQQWNTFKLTRRLTAISVLFWMIYGIPYLIFYDHMVSSSNSVTCVNNNFVFRQYHAYVNNVVLSGGLPVLISVIFGSLAYRNVREIAYRTVPLVRRELDKQLTNMVLVQIVFTFFTVVPYAVATALPLATNLNSDPNSAAQLTLALNITACFYYVYYAGPFYIYFCVSERFRQQLYYVLFHLYLKQWRKEKIQINQVSPQQA